MSSQQTLNLTIPKQQHYGNWVRHKNAEVACGRLALWLVQGGLLWLSSDEVAGKSHFVQALSREQPQLVCLQPAPNHLTSLQLLKTWLNACQHHAYWALDLPAGSLDPAVALATFHLIERAKTMNRALLICWRCDENNKIPPELGSRLRMMAHVDMSAPQDDASLHLVLRSVLKTMQWDMKDTVLPTLLVHVPRTLSDLLDAVEQLDMYSKQHGIKMNSAQALRILGGYH